MTSSPSFAPDNDDDDFDWDAAVMEIDSACAAASSAPLGPAAAPCPKMPKQSTLDRFMESYSKRKAEKELNKGSTVFRTPVAAAAEMDLGGYDGVGVAEGVSDVSIDLEAAKTWIYPVNVPCRDYQLSMAKTALFSNTMVVLPTGLGKTLIAAVVMYNYFRWFPEGKIVFTAPTRPLVKQQKKACEKICGIPEEWTTELTGQTGIEDRSSFWKTKRVFFVTPQILQNDIQQGRCLVKQLVCLVIDEAHRASGNYASCVVVRELMAVPVHLRILALTATPGSNHKAIQAVIDNLCISTLEYRDENDGDVSPYVHDREINLIEVAMSKDATTVDNLLLEAIKPFADQLCSAGVLYHKDFTKLSKGKVIISMQKFHEAPPTNLPHSKYGQIDGYFSLLSSLLHIRNLLSSHGIRPAYEILSEKLRQGNFARLLSRSESIAKAKLLLQQSLSDDAPNPKLVKMIEILIEHFKAKGPDGSRVIIFSNFRESVKDILNSLSSIDLVKATEFIGQSSGKTSKGQSQKMQEAVLQKFRSGGYNVIVATSIGEEGLDIGEVDLVICFDADVSSLRMTQRMGRTGRKHDGRVVVLACEGSEADKYKRNKATRKTVNKLLCNGGTKKFNFHPSRRMVPHIVKPDVQFVEFIIEQKVNDDKTPKSSISGILLDEEKKLISRYFNPSKEDMRKPSLIAFPTLQTFPGRVHTVRHSFRTTAMLIDGMQCLQGLAFSATNGTCALDEVDPVIQPLSDASAALENNERGSSYAHYATNNILEAMSQDKYSETLPVQEIQEREMLVQKTDHPIKRLSSHCFLYGGSFVAVNTSGSVCIAYAPVLPYKSASISKAIPVNDDKESPIATKNDPKASNASRIHNDCLSTHLEDTAEMEVSPKSPLLQYQNKDEIYEQNSPVSKVKTIFPVDQVTESIMDTDYEFTGILVRGSSSTSLKDMDLSPRLTYFVEEGVVPESPMVEHPFKAVSAVCGKSEPDCQMTSQDKLYSIKHAEKEVMVVGECSKMQSDTIDTNEKSELDHKCLSTYIQVDKNLAVVRESTTLLDSQQQNKQLESCNVTHKSYGFLGSSSQATRKIDDNEFNKVQNSPGETKILDDDVRTLLANTFSNSSSENWQLNSGGASESAVAAPKYKRLRRLGDMTKELPCETLEKRYDCRLANTHESTIRKNSVGVDRRKGKKEGTKKYNDNPFIDEEAEVSQDAEVSEDEEDNNNEDVQEDSFIDDRINPTVASAETDTGGDAMAFYRRSLLTQSPALHALNCLDESYDSLSSRTVNSETCSLEKKSSALLTPQNGVQYEFQPVDVNSITCQHVPEKGSSTKLETRKRKLSFPQPVRTDLDAEMLCNDDDDDLFQGLDLDALEEQATMTLRNKSATLPNNVQEDPQVNFLCSPSFNLGI